MSDQFSPSAGDAKAMRETETRKRIDAAAWGAFFIWTGGAILGDVGWGWFLAGIGIIILTAQAAISSAGEKVEALWLGCGVIFLVAGLWEILALRWPLAPLLLIALGAWVLLRAFVVGQSTRQ